VDKHQVSQTIMSALDTITPLCAPIAERWDAEAERRAALRTPANLKALMQAQAAHASARSTAASARSQRRTARKSSGNPLSTTRKAARTADRAARRHQEEARAALRAARRQYPQTLTRLAAQAHAVHTVPAALTSYLLSTPADWTVWPAGSSAALIGSHVLALALGRRAVSAAPVDGDVTAEERRLLERLDPSWWVQHAEERGLGGTLTERPEMTAAGIVCGVRLDGRWSAKELAAKGDQVRALLGMRSETRMEIGRGSHGDRAQLVIRTRSASDGISMFWTPDHEGIGVDETTGDFVDLPLKPGVHVLLAGITGMGKSVSWRPLVMRAVLSEEWTAIVLDPKRQEAIGWQHCLRCVGQEPNRERRMEDIYGLVRELTQEMHRRQGIATGSTWVPDGRPENRCLLVVIDEGAAIVRMAKSKAYADVMDMLEELWSEARSVGFQFVWATQFPTKSVGVPAAVKENMSARLALTTGAGEAERAIFGETAQAEGWTPSRLDGIPGRALLQYGKRKPNPLRLWHVTDGTIAGLPSAEPWRSPAVAAPAFPEQAGAAPTLTLVKTPPAAPVTNRDKVLAAIRAGAVTAREVVDATGINKGTVSREIKALTAAGAVRKGEDGLLTAGEVSA
jgi:S-DNA-T family DNA segregation ATPase FtsK/SpoIIIE